MAYHRMKLDADGEVKLLCQQDLAGDCAFGDLIRRGIELNVGRSVAVVFEIVLRPDGEVVISEPKELPGFGEVTWADPRKGTD